MLGKIIGLLITAALIALGYHLYQQHKTIGYGSQLPGSSNTIQNAKDAVQQDTNYSNKVKNTVQNQYSQ
jgi:hypothetical protein